MVVDKMEQLRRKAVGKRLKELMTEQNVSVLELSKAVGCTSGAISQWRSGQSKMSPDNMQKVCAYLNTTVSYLSQGFNADGGEALFPLSDMEARLIQTCRENFPEDRYTHDEKQLIEAVRACQTLTTGQITEIVQWLSSASASDLVTALSAFKAASAPATLTLEQ